MMTARTSPQRPGTPTWRDLWATDIRQTGQLLSDLFGFVVPPGNEASHGYTTAQIDGRHVLGIGPNMGEGLPDLAVVYLATEDVDATYAKALELGAASHIEPMTVGENGRFATVTDPTGAVVGLWQAGSMIGYEAVDELGFPCWQDLITTNPAAAQEFYGALFGFNWSTEMPGYAIAQFGEDGIFGIGPATNDESHWVQYTMVADLDATIGKARSLGFDIGSSEEMDFGRWSHLTMPGGAYLGIFQASAEAPTS